MSNTLQLHERQQLAIDTALAGKTTTVIGGPGRGKSAVADIIHDKLKSCIIAPTAAAALNIGGNTAHSIFGLGTAPVQTQGDLDKIPKGARELFSVDSGLELLSIDEAYNLRADLLDAIDYKLRKIRSKDTPFGGLQVLMSGDPTQCSPWFTPEAKEHLGGVYRSPFIFHSKVWQETGIEIIILTKNFRNTDVEQGEWLDAIRLKERGWMNAVDNINKMASRYNPETSDALYICTYNDDVDRRNKEKFAQVQSPEKKFLAEITGEYHYTKYPVARELILKEGCRVLFAKNQIGGGYYNGLRGIILKIQEDCIVVEDDNGGTHYVEPVTWDNEKLIKVDGKLKKEVIGKFTQYPFKLGYASSINSSQGLTLNKAVVDFGKKGAFGAGFSFVALSRLTDFRGLELVQPMTYNDVVISKEAKKFIKKYEK